LEKVFQPKENTENPARPINYYKMLVTEDAIIKKILSPKEYILEISNLENFNFNNPITPVHFSTRSKIAQVGVDIGRTTPFRFHEGKAYAKVWLDNFSGVKLKLKEGDRVGRFYQPGWQTSRLIKKTELELLIETGRLTLGSEHRIIPENNSIELTPRGAIYHLKDLKKEYTLEDFSDLEGEHTLKNLGDLDHLLIKEEMDPVIIPPNTFCLTEIRPFKLPENVYGILHNQNKYQYHLLSLFMDPGSNPKNRARLEFFNGRPEPIIPKVQLFLYEAFLQ